MGFHILIKQEITLKPYNPFAIPDIRINFYHTVIEFLNKLSATTKTSPDLTK